MFMGFGPPKRRRFFRSPLRNHITRTREHYYALFSILVVKIVLFIFLWVLFGHSVRIMRTSFKSISQFWRFILPITVAAVALFIGYHIFKNIREIYTLGRDAKRKP
jgi:uncharacterized integral membrane protein